MQNAFFFNDVFSELTKVYLIVTFFQCWVNMKSISEYHLNILIWTSYDITLNDTLTKTIDFHLYENWMVKTSSRKN
jgi:hypothetical protein